VGITADYEGNNEKRPARRPALKVFRERTSGIQNSPGFLEADFCSQLDDPRISGREYLAEQASASVLDVLNCVSPQRVRYKELGVVKDVEEFKPQLQPYSFRKLGLFCDSSISARDSRAMEGVAVHVPKGPESGWRKGVGIEEVVTRASTIETQRLMWIEFLERGYLLRTVPTRVIHERIACERGETRVAEGDPKTSLVRGDSTDSPTVHQSVYEAVGMQRREFVRICHHKTVTSIKRRITSVQ
jgi:hypothetical protein